MKREIASKTEKDKQKARDEEEVRPAKHASARPPRADRRE